MESWIPSPILVASPPSPKTEILLRPIRFDEGKPRLIVPVPPLVPGLLGADPGLLGAVPAPRAHVDAAVPGAGARRFGAFCGYGVQKEGRSKGGSPRLPKNF